MLIFSSCLTDERTQKAFDWINSHPKPIIITSTFRDGWTYNYCITLKDSNNVMFYAGEVEGLEPDTIR